MAMTNNVSTSLDDDLKAQLVEEAAREDRPISAHLRRIVREHFETRRLDRARDRISQE